MSSKRPNLGIVQFRLSLLSMISCACCTKGVTSFIDPSWPRMTAALDGHPGATLPSYYCSSSILSKAVSENRQSQVDNIFKSSVYTGGVAKHLTAKGHPFTGTPKQINSRWTRVVCNEMQVLSKSSMCGRDKVVMGRSGSR